MPPAPDNVEDLRSLARGALAQQDLDTAIRIYARIVALDPRGAEDWFQLGSALVEMNQVDQAQGPLRKAVALRPKNTLWRRHHALLLAELGHHAQSLAQHRKCIADGVPDPATSWVEIARLHERMRQLPKAREAAQRALEADPRHARALQTLGDLEAREGHAEEAERCYRRAIEVGTDLVFKASAQHALGALLEKQKRWDEAFGAHEQANHTLSRTPKAREALRRSLPPFQHEYVRDGAEVLYRRWAEVRFEDGLPSPLLLVGFPRSGTTMTEQALAALPNVRTTDEHPFTNRVYERLVAMLSNVSAEDGAGFLEGLDALTPAQLTELRTAYWNEVWKVVGPDARDRTREGLRIVDKHPLRILDVGLIARLFPHSKVITMIRDPRDCCLSCFFQDLGITEVSARFMRLDTLGDVYATIMGFWVKIRDKVRLEWTEVRYEDLVADFEAQARRLVAFVGEPWTDDVLRFHEKAARRTIATPSYQAVTQKVNTRAVGKWARYESHLGALIERVRPFLETFGYEE